MNVTWQAEQVMDDCGRSLWKDAQQLLSVGDVWNCRVGVVQELREDGAGVRSVVVNLLRRLLRESAHH